MSELLKKNKVLVEDLIAEKSFEFTVLDGRDGVRKQLESVDINRPGLSLTGWYKHFTDRRLQVFGLTELDYLSSLPENQMIEAIEQFFQRDNTAVIITRNIKPPEHFYYYARLTKTPLLLTPFSATEIIRQLIPFLEIKLNPRVIFHGELVEVFGVGILILGKSGIGKSECVLELVRRNHLFIADDIVEVFRNRNNELIGQGSEIIKYHLEIRGVGIINIKTLFGIGAVKDNCKIDLVIEVESWDKDKEYDRVGLDELKKNILGLDITQLCIPIKVGRNLSSIVEIAAMNYRSKKMGFYSVKEFNRRLMNWIQGKEV